MNSAIVRAAAKRIVLSHDRSLLFENGGHIELTKSWAKSLFKRMNIVKRKGNTSKKTFVVEHFMQEKDKYLKSIDSSGNVQNPPELVINWDQTGINIVPVSQWTIEVEGAKRVEITGIDDKRQITGKLFYNTKQLITLLSLKVSSIEAPSIYYLWWSSDVTGTGNERDNFPRFLPVFPPPPGTPLDSRYEQWNFESNQS